MNHKLGICIPYRNREEHLKQLVPHLSKYLTEKGIDFKFYVANQVDDKLLNRGALKNIAAKVAFEEGCDYIAWHDVDMLPKDDCDYSIPFETPLHIATRLSTYNFESGYDQYFGGVILFTKEQVEKTNGYSNEYWDWGQEDDDLFWRCYYEGFTRNDVFKSYKNKVVANFNGNSSSIILPAEREVSSCLNNDHTISVLFNPEQQPEKVPIWLVGDPNKRFIEYPLLRKDKSWTWGLSFNNSRAVTMLYLDKKSQCHYNWGKRNEGMWTWVTMSYSKERQEVYFFLNGDLTCQINGIKSSKPFPIKEELRYHLPGNFVLGMCPHTNVHYKGKIGEVRIHNKFFDNINDIFNNTDDLVLHTDFNNNGFENRNTNFTIEDVNVMENILPYRREGSFICMSHPSEGYVGSGWAKPATALNEKRFVTEMQLGKIDYKKDGMNNLKYDLISTEMFMDNCLMINVKL